MIKHHLFFKYSGTQIEGLQFFFCVLIHLQIKIKVTFSLAKRNVNYSILCLNYTKYYSYCQSYCYKK